MNPLGRFERNIAGEPEYKKIPPEPIYVFRDGSSTDEIVLPEKYKNRKCTDVAFTITLIVFLLFMAAFTIGLVYRTISFKRHQNGQTFEKDHGDNSWNNNYDNNDHDDDVDDDVDDTWDHRRKGKEHGRISKAKSSVTKKKNEIHVKTWCLTVLLMPVTAIFLCLLVFLGLRWCPKGCFWCLMGFNIFLIGTWTITAWASAIILPGFNIALVTHAILWTLLLIGFLVAIWCFRKRIKLIIMTYQEALTAIFKVPMVLFTPLLTILWMTIVFSPMVFFLILLLVHQYDNIIAIYIFFLTFEFYWCALFIHSSQSFVVAGTIASYYFTRDKSNLGSPYCRSLRIYIRFHTGTVAAGSFIIAVLSMLRSLMQQQQGEAAGSGNMGLAALACVTKTFLQCLEEIAQYLTTKAYIMSSIHGKPLCASGKRACRLLWSNLLDTVAVDSIGGCALAGAAFLIIILTSIVAIITTWREWYYAVINKDWENGLWNGLIPYYVGLLLVIFIVIYYLDIISIAVQTIFLCFCEDKEINDGSMSRPYFMSQGLLNVLQTAYNDKYGNSNVQR